MRPSAWRPLILLCAIGAASAGCGVNTIPTLDEKVKSSWAQVENQYQRRADLIPNLVATVKGDELYACIRDLEQKLDRMLRKKANRRLNKRNHPHAVELGSDLPKAI